MMDEIIDQITDIRAKNNLNWMALLRLAFKGYPEESAMIMQQIVKNDEQVASLAKRLAEGD